MAIAMFHESKLPIKEQHMHIGKDAITLVGRGNELLMAQFYPSTLGTQFGGMLRGTKTVHCRVQYHKSSLIRYTEFAMPVLLSTIRVIT